MAIKTNKNLSFRLCQFHFQWTCCCDLQFSSTICVQNHRGPPKILSYLPHLRWSIIPSSVWRGWRGEQVLCICSLLSSNVIQHNCRVTGVFLQMTGLRGVLEVWGVQCEGNWGESSPLWCFSAAGPLLRQKSLHSPELCSVCQAVNNPRGSIRLHFHSFFYAIWFRLILVLTQRLIKSFSKKYRKIGTF